MEKSKIKNLKIRLKAGVLTAVALIPGVSCGRNVGKQEPGANVSIETEANTEKNTSNIITTTTTKGNKTTTNTFVTEPTNNNGYVNNNNNYVDNTTNSNTNSTEAKTENKTNPTTHQNTTQKTTTVKIKNSDIKVTTTKANTPAPTTQAPTTTIKVTEPPVQTTRVEYRSISDRTDLTKYDIISDDELDAKTELLNLSTELANELFYGSSQTNQHGTMPASTAACMIIVNLNYNQNVNIKALGDIFDCSKQQDFIKYSDNMNLAYYQYIKGNKVDFTKYTIDEDLGNYINYITDKYFEYRDSNDMEQLNEELNAYFENNAPYDNYAKYYFMCNTKNSQNEASDEMNEARQIFIDGVTNPLYNDVSQNMGTIRKKVIIY